MSKYAAKNTLDYRLSMMGFNRPISTAKVLFKHKGGDVLCKINGIYGVGWYCTDKSGKIIAYSGYKKSIVMRMEEIYIANTRPHHYDAFNY